MKDSHRLFCFLMGLALLSLATNGALAVGASTPFTMLEAEAGSLGGGATSHAFTPGSTVPSGPTKELEASGMAYVWLTNLNDSVSGTNPPAAATPLLCRTSTPLPPTAAALA